MKNYVERRSCKFTKIDRYDRVLIPIKMINGWNLLILDFKQKFVKGPFNFIQKLKKFLKCMLPDSYKIEEYNI